MKTKTICIFIFMLMILFSMGVEGAAITVNTDGKVTTVELAPVIVSFGEAGKAIFASTDIQYISNSGEPQIPWKVMTVLLPPNANMATVSCSVASVEYKLVKGGCDVMPASPLLTLDENGKEITIWPKNKTIVDGRDIDIYFADAFWPAEDVRLTGTGKLRGWKLAEIAVPLMIYNPVSGELQQLVQAEISVDCDKKGKGDANKGRKLGRIKKLTLNFDEAVGLYEAAQGGGKSEPQDAPASDDGILPASVTGTSGYVIITTNDIRANSTKLADFVTHKENMGFTVTVIDEDDTGATAVGDPAATKLREWLQANYVSMDLKYALIIGDPRVDQGYVPMKMYPCQGRDIPTDYFYAELTCDWDKDNDGIIGEWDADATNGDEIERYFEVYVGRIPHYGVIADTDAILQKTMDYENSTYTGWRRSTLISNVPQSSTMYGYNWGEQVKADILEPDTIRSDRVYLDGYGHTPSMYDINPPAEYPPSAHPATVWSQGQYGLHIWNTHGVSASAFDIISSPEAPYLNDNYPSAVYQGSCTTANPERVDNLAYSILKNGGIVTIGATELSYFRYETEFSDTPSNYGTSYRYAKGIAEGKSCGEALWDLKEETSDWWTHNWADFNAYGDPSVVVMFPAPDFWVKPIDCFYTKRYEGETVVLTNRTYTLENNGTSSLNWTASKTANWFDISLDSGSIPAGGSTTIDVSLNSEVGSLALGDHSDTITFNDTTNGTTVLCDVEYVFEMIPLTTADAYVRGGTNGDNNYGSTATLEIKNHGVDHSYTREAYLRFSTMIDIYPVESATLTLTPATLQDGGDTTVLTVRLLDDGADGWDEDGITYNNRPADTGLDVIFTKGQLQVGVPFDIDVTSLVNQALNTNGEASFHIVNNAAYLVAFHSYEAVSQVRPLLQLQPVISDTTPPDAPTGLVATPGEATVSLDWADNTESDLASYSIYKSTTSGSGYASIATGLATSDYVDNAVTNDTTYYYVATAIDINSNESDNSNEASAMPQAAPETAPTPDPMTFATAPYATGTTSISMTATTATDSSGVEYYFDCTAGGGNDSGWQDSTTYEDTGLTPETQYTYTVTARDKSANQNTTVASSGASATTDAIPPEDTTPPTPDPMTFATAPYATGSTSISMTATTASDVSGVEYLFTCTAGGGNNSSWQDSTTYEDTGLTPDTQYTYTVTARDKSVNLNMTAASAALFATTDPAASEPDMYVNDISMGSRRGGRSYYGQATVWIKDDGGANVAGATVYGNWSGAVSAADSGVTLADGTVMIESPRVKDGGTYTFTVTSIVKAGYVYNSALNVETSDSITAP